MIDVGPIGIWTNDLDRRPAAEAREVAAELDELGYPTLWVGESSRRREAMANAAMLLAATRGIVIATGVASIWARDAAAMVSGQRTLAEAWPHRFLLGIGVSHQSVVAGRGHQYQRPLASMREYLDGMDSLPAGDLPPPPSPPARVLAALGPRMLELARDRAQGAHPFFVPPEHTEMARATLGPGRLLCPEQAVVLAPSRREALELARTQVGYRLSLPNYRNNLLRLGFHEDDLADGGSDRLVGRMVALHTLEDVAARVAEHHEAGADHVALHVLATDHELPLDSWRHLAEML